MIRVPPTNRTASFVRTFGDMKGYDLNQVLGFAAVTQRSPGAGVESMRAFMKFRRTALVGGISSQFVRLANAPGAPMRSPLEYLLIACRAPKLGKNDERAVGATSSLPYLLPAHCNS